MATEAKIDIDLASDTVTRPTPGMREAMSRAPVGDDVFGEDPSIQALETRIAEITGMEDAIFVPSGTMSNQIAIRLHCQPGDEFLCEAGCHINNYEQAGHVQLSGVAPHPVEGEFGVLRLEQLVDRLRGGDEHVVNTRLVCLENTHNRGAGRIQPFDEVARICQWAHDCGLACHLDGARIFNAAVASGRRVDHWCRNFDTVSVCFSKGLGAPVGSALCGSASLIRNARRHRKVLGGGMRQAGIVAAGALYALEHHMTRLADDHENAQLLAEALRQVDGIVLDPDIVETNMVIFRVERPGVSATEFCCALQERGVRMLDINHNRVRAVMHLDVSQEQARRAGQLAAETLQAMPCNR